MNSRQKTEYTVLFVIIILGCGLLTAFAVTRINNWRLEKSKYYLHEAKKSDIASDQMLYFEKAAALYPNEETYLNAGISALRLGNNALGQKYLTRVKTAEGYFQLANAYYNLGNFPSAATGYKNAIGKENTEFARLGLAKSYLKMGDIRKAKTELAYAPGLAESKRIFAILNSGSASTSTESSMISAYNQLQTLGYPQAAMKLLEEGAEKGKITRDGLITLANDNIASADYQQAYDNLLKAKAMDSYYPQVYKQLVIVCVKLGKNEEARQYQAFYNYLII